jgi:hypothetical protein
MNDELEAWQNDIMSSEMYAVRTVYLEGGVTAYVKAMTRIRCLGPPCNTSLKCMLKDRSTEIMDLWTYSS